jgi:hypothetical protein
MKHNGKFWWAVYICRDLKIDDPIHWMNEAGDRLDLWIAWHLNLADEQEKQTGRKVDPNTFFEDLYRGKGKGSRQSTLGLGGEFGLAGAGTAEGTAGGRTH